MLPENQAEFDRIHEGPRLSEPENQVRAILIDLACIAVMLVITWLGHRGGITLTSLWSMS